MRINHEHRLPNKSYRFDWDDSLRVHKDNDLEMHLVEVGNTIVTKVQGRGGVDALDMFAGLPNEMCQASHWGIVLNGHVRIVTPDGAIDCKTGDAYYQAVPHRVEWVEDSTLVEFSPREEFWITQEAIERNAAKQQ